MVLQNIKKIFLNMENWLAVACLALIAIFPTLEVITRRFKTGVPSSTEYIYHLVLWITFIGGMITSREGNHLSLAATTNLLKEPLRTRVQSICASIAVAVAACLSWSSFYFVRVGIDAARNVGIFPSQAVLMIMPVGFAVMAFRFISHAPKGLVPKSVASLGLAIPLLLGIVLSSSISILVWPASILLVISAVFGTPIFIVLGGIAALLFFNSGGTTAVIPNEAYTMLTGPVLPAIPLFTLAGFILSESKAGERLVRVFRVFFGWLPGGLAIVAILICTFFTALTGASGVTILALGGLLSYMLRESRYDEKFTTGLLTVNGIGIMFPPSLPIIMFGVVAQISIVKMFVGMLLPATVTVLSIIILAIIFAHRKHIERIKFDSKEAVSSLFNAFWELLIPVIILVFFFGGITTLVETGAITVLYVIIIETLVHKDMKLKELMSAFMKSMSIIGGVLVILAVAKGLSYFIVDAEVPMLLTEWLQRYVGSKYVFLLLLNIALLIVGCFMDIFSATIVVVPLILPLAEAYGINPIHLGAIFLANLEIGYLTPPVGINLFLASYRFEKPLGKIYLDVLPFLAALFIALIFITYVPAFSTVLVDVFFK